jgi:hypothetical protein
MSEKDKKILFFHYSGEREIVFDHYTMSKRFEGCNGGIIVDFEIFKRWQKIEAEWNKVRKEIMEEYKNQGKEIDSL